jgi:hypothetical protein
LIEGEVGKIMMHNKKLAGFAAAAVLATGMAATSAGAVTVVANGGVYNVPGDDTQFIGDVKDRSGGAGMYTVTFNAAGSSSANATVTIGALVASTFADLTMSWVGADDAVIDSAPVTPIFTSLSTMFLDPESLSQSLVFSWTDSLVNSGFDFEVEISPIPLPAAGLMLLTGIAGLGAIRSRRKASVEA